MTVVEVAPEPEAEKSAPILSPPTLPFADFWDRRPTLRYIHDLARARRTPPAAVLGAVLARVCAASDYRILTPNDITGSYGTPNLIVVLAAPSGFGKGNGFVVGEEALESLGIEQDFDVVPTGTGEGLINAFCDEVEVKISLDAEHSAMRTVQVRYNVLLSASEGVLLAKTMERSGQTIAPMLQKAWSGEDLGRQLADRVKSGTIPPLNYRFAALLALQPAACKFIFDAEGIGLPQRLVWFAAMDPDIPDVKPPVPEVPDELTDERIAGEVIVRLRPVYDEDDCTVDMKGVHFTVAHVDDSIKDYLDHLTVMLQRGEIEAISTHGSYLMLKLALALAFLEKRNNATADDWDLAQMLLLYSIGVTEWVKHQLSTAESVKGDHAARQQGRRQVLSAEATAAAKTAQVVHYAELLAKAIDNNKGSLPERDFERVLRSDKRTLYLADAVAYGEETGQFRKEGNSYIRGSGQ